MDRSTPGQSFGQPMKARQWYEPHPIAMIFPRLSIGGISDLAESIKEQGQLETAVIFEGMMLDGISRQEACRMNYTRPRIKALHGSTPRRTSIFDGNQP